VFAVSELETYIYINCSWKRSVLIREVKTIKMTFNRVLACSISENLANKSSGIDQSKTSKFSLILPSCVLFGSTLWPICRPQRMASCAGVLPSFSATLTRIGFLRTSLFNHVVPGEPKGEYPYIKSIIVLIELLHNTSLQGKLRFGSSKIDELSSSLKAIQNLPTHR
jgi:hypothetical protein